MTLLRDKRFLICFALIALLGAEFWAGSRYPALNEKLMMGADTPLAGLAFSPLLEIAPDAEVVSRVFRTTINWIYTNRQGMTFGILLGALLMTTMRLFEWRNVRSRYGNTAIGLLIGAPMGVCANCAAPIGKGLHAAGGRVETMLAVMVSSPTLNVLVLTMLFALFPAYVAIIKIALTLVFVMVGIPLLTRFIGRSPTAAVAAAGAMTPPSALAIPGDQSGAPQGMVGSAPGFWLPALRWVVSTALADLWFIVRTTVPLMLLAGFLGSVVITLVPLESLAQLLPNAGYPKIILAMILLSLFGVFLPVPMSFDVIVTAILWNAGLPAKYALILLFTLGISSIFPIFIVWKDLGAKFAAAMYLSLAVVGVAAGLIGHQFFKQDTHRQQAIFLEEFARSATKLRGPKVSTYGGQTREVRSEDELVPALLREAGLAIPVEHGGADGVAVARVQFQAATAGALDAAGQRRLFTRHEGMHFGIDEPYSFSVLSFESPSALFRGIASGDVHNDGWTDILITSTAGLSLYANRQGKGFALQRIDIPELKEYHIVNAALVDLNNDGWLDIYFSSYRRGNHVIYNDRGRFSKSNLYRLPGQRDAVMTAAVAFGDVDRDGNLDIAMGSWTHPLFHGADATATNTELLRSVNGGFRPETLELVAGQSASRQTLSMLLSDINGDGKLDLIVGNEDRGPDNFYIGGDKGKFRPITRTSGMIPHSTATTMSVTSADIDNDLAPEIYIGQISNTHPQKGMERDVSARICDEIVDAAHRRNCREILSVHVGMPSQTKPRDVAKCATSVGRDYREDCIAYSLLLWARQRGNIRLCGMFPDAWAAFRFICQSGYGNAAGRAVEASKDIVGDAIPVILDRNVLLAPRGDGGFVDKAVDMGVQFAGFTWNAKFADLDNDEYQDLYAVHGWFPSAKRESNFFYRNLGGKSFSNQTESAGLRSFLPTSAYTFVDIDNDGDLDIVSVPIAGPVLVFVNNSEKNRIAIELRDEIGNRFGIGSKVIIHYGADGRRHQVREMQAGGGFISFDAPAAYFGMGDFKKVDRIEVRWSTGERSELSGDFGVGARYIVTRLRDGRTKSSEQRPGTGSRR